ADPTRRILRSEMSRVWNDLERGTRNRGLQLASNARRQKRVVLTPDDRGRSHDVLQSRRERGRIRAVEREQVLHERVAPFRTGERAHVELDGASALLVI